MQNAGRIFFIFFVMALVLVIALIGSFIAWLSGAPFFLPLIVVLYIAVGIFVVRAVMGWKGNQKMYHRLTTIAVFLSLLYTVPGIYEKTRPVIQDGYVDMYVYAPFAEQSKVVQLKEPVTLKIEEELPIIDGATALYPVYAAFAQAIYPEKNYDPYNSEVMSNRTGEAYDNLINGRVDMIFALAPSKDQIARAEKNNRQLTLTPIGKEAFVFFVNEKNPVKSLTTDEIKGIYTGEIDNWKDIGGKKKAIRAFQRPEDSGSQTALQHFMGDTPIMDPPVEDIALLMGTMLDVVSDYKNYNNAIGYTFRYYSTEMTSNNNIRLLSVNEVEPTTETIQSGDYPITNEIYAITAGSQNPHIDEFIDWILSEQGQEIVEKTGYVMIE